jgi:hypothetical protein
MQTNLHRASVLAALLLIALMAILAWGAVRRELAVFDEVAHVGAGLSYVQKLDLRLNEEHPPLVKVLAALPLVVRGVHTDYTQISWTISRKFFPAYLAQWIFGAWVLNHWNASATVLEWARLPMLGLTLFLAWAVFRIGSRLGGDWGGLLSLAAYVTTPTFLTFGPLVLTDTAITLFVILTLWSMGELWSAPTRKNIAVFALCLAAALLSKFSALVLFIVLPIFAWSLRFRSVSGMPKERDLLRQWRRLRARAAGRGIAGALAMVYAFYFFFSIRQPSDALYFLGSGPIALVFRRLLLPFALYLRGVFWVVITGSRPTFLLGHIHPHGVWYYFPIAFLLKSTTGFLGLLLLALGLWGWRRWMHLPSILPPELDLQWRALWTGFWVFTTVCLLSPLTISIRHFGFSIVLLIVFLAVVPRMLASLHAQAPVWAKGSATAAILLVLCCIASAVRAYPYYFPYINALGFGRPAYMLLSDSNVDWDQAFPDAETWVQQHGMTTIGLDAYGFTDPTFSIPQAHIWDCQYPAAQDAGHWQIVSADMFLDAHNCAWLLHYEREPIAGGSMYAVRLPNPLPQPGSVNGPPTPGQTRVFLGFSSVDIRTMFVKLEQHPEHLPEAIAMFEHLQTSSRGTSKATKKP